MSVGIGAVSEGNQILVYVVLTLLMGKHFWSFKADEVLSGCGSRKVTTLETVL